MAVKKKNKNLEDILQTQCVAWFKLQYPRKLLFSIPNAVKFSGNNKDPRARGKFFGMMKKAKNMGLSSGVPDMMIPGSSNGFHGLFVELKVGDKTTSESQDSVIAYLRSQGYLVEVIYTFDEFVATVKDYFQ